jgi:hypothetical protein
MLRRVVIGVTAGCVLWVALAEADILYRFRGANRHVPKSERGVADAVMTGVAFAAWPVQLGGYFLVWGESPPSWAQGRAANVAIGLILYGALGAMTGAICRRGRMTVRPSEQKCKAQAD